MAERDEAVVSASADRGVSGVPAELAQARVTIDNIDAALVHILAERFRCTQRVGHIKARLDLPPARPARSSACAPWPHPLASTPISLKSSWASWSAKSSATTRTSRPSTTRCPAPELGQPGTGLVHHTGGEPVRWLLWGPSRSATLSRVEHQVLRIGSHG